MKTMKHFLSMAALALMGAMMTGCSNDDNIDNAQQPESKSKLETLTTTISLGEDGTTRALTSDGVKTFAVGDQIAVLYSDTDYNIKKATSTALKTTDISNEGKTATFTVTLSDPDKTEMVCYVYPASMVNDDGNVNVAALMTQDGTLDTLGSSLEYAAGYGNWNGEELPSVDLVNSLAILAITLKDADGTNDITSTITGMTLSDGTNTYTVTREAAAGPIYVAINPVLNSNLTITATDGTKNYFKSLTGKTYARNNGYNVSWKMYGVGDVILENGTFAPAGTDGAIAKITYVGSDAETSTTYNHGLALALEDADSNAQTWCAQTSSTCLSTQYDGLSMFNDVAGLANTVALVGSELHAHDAAFSAIYYNGATHPDGTSGWFLPSAGQWRKMATAVGGYDKLGLQADVDYWSSTEASASIAWYFNSDTGYWYDDTEKDNGLGVRACIAF